MKNLFKILILSLFTFSFGQDCDEGYVPDCSGDGDCCSEDWIGDGYCDNEDQSWGCDLICYEEELSDCGHFPQLYYHPNELSEQLEQNNSSTIIFTIVNNGDEDLEWEVINQDEIPNWLSFTIYGGLLESGSLDEIDVTFDSSELNVGEYNTTITISSNDPFNVEIVIPVSMTIISQSTCDEDMYWSDCGLPFYCNPTCLNPEPFPECDDYCEIGCFCNEGYIFSDDTFNECILIEGCSEIDYCDLNSDGEINILDIIIVLNCILDAE